MSGIIFIAPPAAGKGTQSDMICEKYGFIHISTGDLLRDASKEENLEALYIEEQMESGELIDDSLMIDLLEKRLLGLNTRGFILDGFPRNLNQANIFDQMIEKNNINKLYVFHIDVPFEECMKRTVGRMICPNCKDVYNSLIENLKPMVSEICDNCKIPLEKRADDNEETFKNRFDLYLEETEPLIRYYKQKGKLYEIDGNKDKNEIFIQIDRILGSDIYD